MESDGQLAWREFVQVGAAENRPRVFGPLSRLHIAHSVAVNDVFVNLSGGEVYIDEFVNLAHGVMLLTGAHDYRKRDKERMDSGAFGRDIRIGRGAWVCSRAVICGPVTIGEHAVICAGAVVVKDVPPWTMVGGNPARRIKYIEES